MFFTLVNFYLGLCKKYFLSHHFHADFIFVDSDHPHYRRYSQRYRKKQGVVKIYWLLAGLITLFFPFLHVLFFVFMLTTFLSFSYLDETPD